MGPARLTPAFAGKMAFKCLCVVCVCGLLHDCSEFPMIPSDGRHLVSRDIYDVIGNLCIRDQHREIVVVRVVKYKRPFGPTCSCHIHSPELVGVVRVRPRRNVNQTARFGRNSQIYIKQKIFTSQFSWKTSWNWQKYLISTILYFTVNITEPLFFLIQKLIYPFKSENKNKWHWQNYGHPQLDIW